MRLFIALEIPPVLKDDMAIMSRQLRASIQGRFIPPENYHITLAFIGEMPSSEIALIQNVIEKAAAHLDGITLTPHELGKFGRSEDATLWLGFTENPALEQLANNIREGLVESGIPFDHKPFKAHATIARRARIPKGALPPFSFPDPARAWRITLYKSTLEREGAIYEALYTKEALLPK